MSSRLTPAATARPILIGIVIIEHGCVCSLFLNSAVIGQYLTADSSAFHRITIRKGESETSTHLLGR